MTTATEKEILMLLERKRAIDNLSEGQYVENGRWLRDAVEFLLRHQLKLHDVLLRHQLELHDELRNNGIIR